MPVKDDIASWSVILSTELKNHRILKYIQNFVLLSPKWPTGSSKWAISSYMYTKFLMEFDEFILY